MALLPCPECNREISDRATACPQCGCPISKLRPSAEPTSIPSPKQVGTSEGQARRFSLSADAAKSHVPIDPNPFAAPKAELTTQPTSESPVSQEAEEVRRKYLKHESRVRSIGILYLLSGTCLAFGVIFILIRMGMTRFNTGQSTLAVVYGLMAGLFLTASLGLRKRRLWGRWVGVAASGTVLACALIGEIVAFFSRDPEIPALPLLSFTAIPFITSGLFLYILLSNRSRFVFTENYLSISGLTPHLKSKTSCLTVFILFLIGLVIDAMIGATLALPIAHRINPEL